MIGLSLSWLLSFWQWIAYYLFMVIKGTCSTPPVSFHVLVVIQTQVSWVDIGYLEIGIYTDWAF